MSGFPTIQLGEVTTKVGSGSTPRGGEAAYKSTGTPLIRSMNVHFGGFREEGLAYIDDDQAAALRNVEVRARDVLLNITGASIGRVTIAPPHMDGARVNQHVCIIRPDDRLETSFLRWFLASPHQQRLINSMESGATRQALTKEKILAFEVPLPSLAMQHEIVAELEKQFSRLDEAVANLQRVKANLKRYKASVLKAAVEGRLVETEATLARREGRTYETGEQLLQRILAERRAKWTGKGKYKEPSYPKIENSSDLPPGWAYASIDQLAYVDVGFAFKSAEFSSEGLRLLRGENIEPGRLRWTETRYWPESRLAGFRNLLLEEGEIILAMDRPLISSGLKLARVRASDLPCLLVQRVARLRCVDKGMESYLHSCMSTQVFERHLLDGQTGTQLPHVSGASIGAFVVPVPPASEQIRVAAEVDRHLSIIREVEAEVDANLQRAQALRQATLISCFQNKGG